MLPSTLLPKRCPQLHRDSRDLPEIARDPPEIRARSAEIARGRSRWSGTIPPTLPNQVCKDDFREIAFFDEGEEIAQKEAGAEAHPDFGAYHVNPVFEGAAKRIGEQNFDWITRSASHYACMVIEEAYKWMDWARQQERTIEPATEVDVEQLNDGQQHVYDTVVAHDAQRQISPTQPLRALVCGTAGSGKTYLIRALKQHLGGACLVLAPTGVAADNINGQTYHSVLPMPSRDIDRDDIIPKDRERIQRMVSRRRARRRRAPYFALDPQAPFFCPLLAATAISSSRGWPAWRLRRRRHTSGDCSSRTPCGCCRRSCVAGSRGGGGIFSRRELPPMPIHP